MPCGIVQTHTTPAADISGHMQGGLVLRMPIAVCARQAEKRLGKALPGEILDVRKHPLCKAG
jgi:hypothetical protein